jgi:hypothetical protein
MQTKTIVTQLATLATMAFFLSIILQGIRVYFVTNSSSDWIMFFGGISAAIVFVCVGVAIILIPQDWEAWVERNIPLGRPSLLGKFWGGILFVCIGLLVLILSLRNLLLYLGYI